MTSPALVDEFQRELVTLIPHLRAFARSLCGDPSQADDLAQEAVAKAWKNRDRYEPGTNMKGWTFMILRNQFYSEKRRSWRSVPLDQEKAERTLVATSNADDVLALDDLRQALATLPATQREALMLVGAGGLSYDEAAHVTGVAIGTIKSRVSRARMALQTVLERGDYARDGQPAGRALDAIMASATTDQTPKPAPPR